MARLYGDLRGNRGETTRMGHKSIRSHVRGWNIGAYASVVVNENDEDVVSVTITRGSNGGGIELALGSFKLVNDEIVKI